jgi:branched-chain amino acid transport system permease protein
MMIFIQTVITGIMVGSLYSLVALGVVIIYKSTDVFNFAQGEILMLGSFMAWTFLVAAGLPMWITIVMVLAFAILMGMTIEFLIMRPMVGESILSMIIVTLALGALLSGVGNLIWGKEDYYLLPELMSREPVILMGMSFSRQHLAAFVISMVFMGIFSIFFRYAKWGLEMRAVAIDHQVARSTGISTKTVFALSWVVASIVGVVAGVLLGTISGVTLGMPVMAIKAFPVIILAGLESIPGVIIAGPLVGVLEYLAGRYVDPLVGGGTMDVAPFVILILILIIKPYGLFGQKRIERV